MKTRHPQRSILVVSSEFPPGPGGIGTHACQMVSHLRACGWTVEVVTAQDYASVEDIERFGAGQDYRVWRVLSGRGHIRGFLSRWKTLARRIKIQRPAAIIATGAKSVWTSALAARLYGVPLIAVGHGSEFGFRNSISRVVTRWAFGQADLVICVSEFTRRLMKSLGASPHRDVVIPNGADEMQYFCLPPDEVSEVRNNLGFEADHILLTVGSVTERKGQETVIRAIPHVLSHHPRTHYLMAGLPMRQRFLEELAVKLRIREHVHFLGRLEAAQLLRILNASDVFLMTSRITSTGDCEGFGIAIVEAAFCGKPSIVSVNSGPAEAILDGVTGLAVAEGDERATAAAICRLLGDPALRKKMGQAAKDRALRQQTWRARFQEYNELLESVT